MEQYIGIPPRGLPLALHWMCFLFPCDASAAVSKLAQHLLAHLLDYLKKKKKKGLIHLAAKSGTKQEKEEKRKHDSGKLSDGDKIDLMIII